MEVAQAQSRGLVIFSLEDEPETIEGSLDSLEFEGHRIERCETVASARRVLSEREVNLVLLDEHVSGDDDAGSKLITELKAGALGQCNIRVPFGFVTASRAWVNQEEVSSLQGYLGVEIKGNALTRSLMQWTESLLVGADEDVQADLRRVPIYVEGVETGGREGGHLLLVIPAWDPHEKVRYAISSLPKEMLANVDELAECWFIARMTLYEPDPFRIVIRDWEPQEPLDDDDGPA